MTTIALVDHRPSNWKGRAEIVDGHILPVDTATNWAPPTDWRWMSAKRSWHNRISRMSATQPSHHLFITRLQPGGRCEWEMQTCDNQVLRRGFAPTLGEAMEAAEKAAANHVE